MQTVIKFPYDKKSNVCVCPFKGQIMNTYCTKTKMGWLKWIDKTNTICQYQIEREREREYEKERERVPGDTGTFLPQNSTVSLKKELAMQ